MPLFKSFADFFILNYVTLTQGMQPGFTFGCYEDTPRIKLFDTWLQKCGYIFSRRAQDQSITSNYTNSALLKELIDNCPMTTLFMNGQRFRSGKLAKRMSGDMSVKWLLDAYFSFSKQQGQNVTVVPVMINYDRKFEAGNIADEMVSGVKKDYTLFTSMQKITDMKNDNLG